MSNYDALFEDEDDMLTGSPRTTYWGMNGQMSQDVLEDEFDKIVQRLAVMEDLLSQNYEIEALDDLIKCHYIENSEKIENLKKSVYMELGGKLIYRLSE